MKHDGFLNKLQAIGMAFTLLGINACSQAPETPASGTKPKHIWSDQVETIHEAKEVASYANELQALQDERLRERGGER